MSVNQTDPHPEVPLRVMTRGNKVLRVRIKLFLFIHSENSEEAKTADLISVGGPKEEPADGEEKSAEGDEGREEETDTAGPEDTLASVGSNGDPEEARVDEDGYTIRPPPKAPLARENPFDSSSDSDSENGECCSHKLKKVCALGSWEGELLFVFPALVGEGGSASHSFHLMFSTSNILSTKS